MALPSVATPKFDVILPSNGQSVKIRPFLVKEQKLVLNAIEMQDTNQLYNALDDVLRECTFNELDIDSLTVYDVEFLIMQIRSRSVGDFIEVNYVCNNVVPDKLLNAEALKFDPNAKEVRGEGVCETRIPVKINLSTLECKSDAPRPDNRIMFTDTLGVVMRDLPYGVYKKMKNDSMTVDTGLMVMAESIECVFDAERVYNRGDFSDEEMNEWLGSLMGDHFDKMKAFIDTMPTLSITLTLKCPSCGAEETVHLKGLEDFLA